MKSLSERHTSMCVRVGEGGLSENEAAVTVADIFGFIRRGGGGG